MSLNSIVSRVPRIETILSAIHVNVYQLLEICGRKYLMVEVIDDPIKIQSDRGHLTSPQCIPISKYNSNNTFKLEM